MTNPEPSFAAAFKALEELSESLAKGPVHHNLRTQQKTEAMVRQEFADHLRADANHSDTLLAALTNSLRAHNCQVGSRGYLGYSTPPVSAGVALTTALGALINPQLAVAAHAPGAIAIEKLVVEHFLRATSIPQGGGGHFCHGGSEAILTGLASAIAESQPNIADEGWAQSTLRPRIYASSAAHDCLVKAAAILGIGKNNLRRIEVDADERMSPKALERAIQEDLKGGYQPLAVVATIGTTATGAMDPLAAIAAITKKRKIWLHVDAAWAGVAVLSPHLSQDLGDLSKADSLNIDLHKWLPIPLGTALFLTRSTAKLTAFLAPEKAAYLATTIQRDDPIHQSLAWSRGCLGLKAFYCLASLGAEGTAQYLEDCSSACDKLQAALEAKSYRVFRQTRLPLITFVKNGAINGSWAARAFREVLRSGNHFLGLCEVGGQKRLRACFANPQTGSDEIAELVKILERVAD